MANISESRPDPEALLRELQAEEEYQKHGRLKLFLGYISGVGKSFRMFDEGRRRRQLGEDVVVGAIKPVKCPAVEDLLTQLVVIPLNQIEGGPVMDVQAILRRHPQVCLVDGIAYDNPEGSLNAKRWQDVNQLLAAGISVVASVNLQYIDEYRERVEKITSKRVTETIPLSFVNLADEIEVVDAPAEFCLEQADGVGADAASNLGPQKLSELREIALLLAADVVDRQLERYLQRNGIEAKWGAQERILVCIKPGLNAQKMIESGRRNADRFHGELFVVYVSHGSLSPQEEKELEGNLAVAGQLNARIESLTAEDPVHAIMTFARAHGITQLFVGHTKRESWWSRLFGDTVDQVIREAEGIDVRVFPN